MTVTILAAYKNFNGTQFFCRHTSNSTQSQMQFGLYVPPPIKGHTPPVVYALAGLTCNEETFAIKAGAQRLAAELGLAIVTPDTSPRGLNLPGETESDDFGTAAGFYLNATVPPWNKNYHMYRYIVDELPLVIAKQFSIDTHRAALLGHSMGGHGALTIALKNPERYQSVSALAPICAPMQCPWGIKAFTGYLGEDQETWREYDATELVQQRGWQGPEILIDQGTNDKFLHDQLKPDLFKSACDHHGVKLNLRMQPDYEHNYFFVASFIEDHLRFHAANLA